MLLLVTAAAAIFLAISIVAGAGLGAGETEHRPQIAVERAALGAARRAASR